MVDCDLYCEVDTCRVNTFYGRDGDTCPGCGGVGYCNEHDL